MADKNKNFWLKLQKDFFKRHDVKIIEAMPNGIEIAYLYIKLLAESITHDGRLRFSETVPYTNKMLSAVLGTDEEIVNQAIDIFISLNLVEILEDQTIYMTELQNMVGCETKDAERMRRMRNRNNVTDNRNNVQNCYIEKEKELDKEKDLDKDLELERDNNVRTPDNLDEEFTGWGLYCNVQLSREEYNMLKSEFPNTFVAMIDNLSEYLYRHPKKRYASHYDTIIRWNHNDLSDALKDLRGD